MREPHWKRHFCLSLENEYDVCLETAEGACLSAQATEHDNNTVLHTILDS